MFPGSVWWARQPKEAALQPKTRERGREDASKLYQYKLLTTVSSPQSSIWQEGGYLLILLVIQKDVRLPVKPSWKAFGAAHSFSRAESGSDFPESREEKEIEVAPCGPYPLFSQAKPG